MDPRADRRIDEDFRKGAVEADSWGEPHADEAEWHTEAVALTEDVSLRYLGHLFTGWILASLGRTEEAATSYRSAIPPPGITSPGPVRGPMASCGGAAQPT